MKRILSLILVSVLLLATVFMCKVDAKAADVEKMPFYLSNWETLDTEEYPNLYGKPYLWATRNGDEVKVSYGANGSTIAGLAQNLKDLFDTYPENSGMRIFNYAVVMRRYLSEMTEDVVYMDKGAEKLEAYTRELLAECKRIGVKLDGVYSDLEYLDGYYWYLYTGEFQSGNQEIYYQITQHPSYQTKLRPMLEERGFQFYPKPLDSMPDGMKKVYCELYSIHPSSGDKFHQSRRIWDVVVQNMWNQYMNESVFEPLQEYYPDAMFTDYKNNDGYGWMKNTNENNYDVYLGGNTIKVGTHNANNMYNYCPQFVTESENSTSYVKPVSHYEAVYEDSAFGMALWEINSFKDMLIASDNKLLYVDPTSYDYGLHYGLFKDEPTGTAAGTPYHAEEYFHLGLMNVVFGGYFIESEAENSAEHDYKQQVVQEILDELNKVAGYADRKAIEIPSNWNDSFILSGMYANGRNIWRITPDIITGVSKKNFLVSTDNGQIVFKNKGQTITFPQGKIIEDGDISAVGTCGYWVETPADVMPTVTYDKDRFEKNPAYAETFDNYETGIDFNYKNAQYTHTWETFAWEGASATIAEVSGKDKALALTGSVFLSNVKLPEYITAGDDYAKQQVWQTVFSLSALPTGDAEIKLLNATSGSGTGTDGGFRIFDGKLYYGKVGEYQTFENVTLAANTEYTVKRVLDFRTENAFTSSYYVYDASGNLLDKAENVAMDTMTLPVQKIGLSTQSFNDTLYVDDYKLYATGLGYTFEVYKAATGIELEDPTAAYDFDVAYRFSWMNNSGATKTYNVIATYADGTKEIVKTVTMAPGAAAVDTGIVKADGKKVALSVEELATTDDGTDTPDGGASDDGTSDGTSTNGKKGLSNGVLLIVLLSLTVVLIGLVIAVLLIPGKIKKDETEADSQTGAE